MQYYSVVSVRVGASKFQVPIRSGSRDTTFGWFIHFWAGPARVARLFFSSPPPPRSPPSFSLPAHKYYQVPAPGTWYIDNNNINSRNSDPGSYIYTRYVLIGGFPPPSFPPPGTAVQQYRGDAFIFISSKTPAIFSLWSTRVEFTRCCNDRRLVHVYEMYSASNTPSRDRHITHQNTSTHLQPPAQHLTTTATTVA